MLRPMLLPVEAAVKACSITVFAAVAAGVRVARIRYKPATLPIEMPVDIVNPFKVVLGGS